MSRKRPLRSFDRISSKRFHCVRSRANFITNCMSPTGRAHRRRAGGSLRTLVVGAATFAGLLVCFSIYRSAQLGESPGQRTKPQRFSRSSESTPETAAPSTQSGVKVKDAVIGGGRNVRVSLYPREGSQAMAELAVREWIPVEGSPDKVRLTEPEIRMFTRDGHGLRATAREGLVSGQIKQGGFGIERGSLFGEVLIEYDRLSREERANLPGGSGDPIDPSQIVRIETERIEFDREYGKVVVAGEVHVWSPRDLDFRSSDIEVHINEADNRIESARFGRGGRLEIRGPVNQFGLSVPTSGGEAKRRLTMVDWLRLTLQTRLDAGQKQTSEVVASADSKPVTPDDDVVVDEQGVPTFRLGSKKKNKPTGDVQRYVATFEKSVDARQFRDEALFARLQADRLEVERELSSAETPTAQSPKPESVGSAPTMSEPTPSERIVLEWAGSLRIASAAPPKEDGSNRVRSRITVDGAPVRIQHPEADITCAQVVYQPDLGGVDLFGASHAPVVVDSVRQGTLTGMEVRTRQSGDKMLIDVTGPGTMRRSEDEASLIGGEPSPGDVGSTMASGQLGNAASVEFSDRLEVVSRTAKITTVDFSGGIVTREVRAIERAAFSGRVKLREDDVALSADALDAEFSVPSRRNQGKSWLEHVVARGQVDLSQGDNRLTGRELDTRLMRDSTGRLRPTTAIVSGDALAVQGDRQMRAGEKLIVDFAESTMDVAVADGQNPDAKPKWTIQRVRASRDVTISDPNRPLEITVDELDATLGADNQIEAARLLGTTERPAFARLDDVTIAGKEITLNAREETADFPGEGRMTFLSVKDLNGKKLDKPSPLVVTWTDRMRYRGKENRALFMGNVHATGESNSTFDTDQLAVEFEDVPQQPTVPDAEKDWWVFQPVVDAVRDEKKTGGPTLQKERFSKEPTRLVAVGKSVATMTELDPDNGELRSRARLAGPRLSVDLRREIAKLLIEGPGTLLIEDFRKIVPAKAPETKSADKGMFGADDRTGLSKTLIEWQDAMRYDFAIDQARFEGDATLKHFSGSELAKVADVSAFGTEPLPPGRSTFLKSDVLTVDFLEKGTKPRDADAQRLSSMSAQRLRQFRSSGKVTLQDRQPNLSLALTADEVIYERDRDLLAIYGEESSPAHLVTQKPKELPRDVNFLRAFYRLSANELEVTAPTAR